MKEFIEKSKTSILKPSYLDLKIGTNCVLKDKDSPEYKEFREIDLTTTTVEYGYRVTGVCIL